MNISRITSIELQKELQKTFDEFKKEMPKQKTWWLKQTYQVCEIGIDGCNDQLEKINEHYYDGMEVEKLHENERKNIILKSFWEKEKELIREEIFKRAV